MPLSARVAALLRPAAGVALAAAVGLGPRTAFADPPAAAPTTPAPTAATAAWGDQRVAPASLSSSADLLFQERSQAFALSTGRHVAAWGTLFLDGAHPSRFATLLPDNDARGAYILEVGPGAVQVLTFEADGRTVAFGAADPPLHWIAHAETSLAHSAGHHRGGEDFALALDRGVLVLVRYRYIDDVREHSRGDIDATYRAPHLPLASSRTYQDSALVVGAPVPLTAALEG